MKLKPPLFPAILIACLLVSIPSRGFSKDDRLKGLEQEVTGLKQENEGLKKRLDNLETDQDEIKNYVSALSRLVDVSGYADVEYDLTDNNTTDGSYSKFSIRHLSLFFSEEITKQWRLFSEVEFENAPHMVAPANTNTLSKAQGEIFVEEMYIEYNPSLYLDARLGRFLTPFGIWSIFHYPPYVPFQTNPFFFNKTFPEVSDGVQLRYTFPVRDMPLDAIVYAANGAGNAGGADGNTSKALGARLNFEVVPGTSFGGSYYRDKDNLNILRDNYGAHLAAYYRAFRLQAEYTVRENEVSGGPRFRDNGFYAMLTYDIEKWTLAARYDRCRCAAVDEQAAGGALFRYTGAVNYHFAHNLLGKVEYDRTVSPDRSRDENRGIVAIAVAVGDF